MWCYSDVYLGHLASSWLPLHSEDTIVLMADIKVNACAIYPEEARGRLIELYRLDFRRCFFTPLLF